MSSFIIHYHEIALKGKNRSWFVTRLVENLRRAVSDLDVSEVRALMGRIELVLGPTAQPDQIGERIRQTFGVANYAYADRVSLEMDVITSAILSSLKNRQCHSFRVSARRADKRFPLTSPEIERELGSRIQESMGWKVNLNDPELVIYIQLLSNEAFYFFDKTRAAGGLPTGTAGRVVALLSGGIYSPVAAFKIMKRGCAVTFIHFHSYPILSRASQEKAHQLVDLLTRYQQHSRLYLVPFSNIQQKVVLSIPGPMRVIIYRRLMFRIAERLAHIRHAQALVTGEAVGQVASQTLENIAVIENVANLPIFRPLIGMDKDEIIAEAQKLETYPISIIPDQDCCTLFMPSNPLTRGRLPAIIAAEQVLPISDFVESAIREATVEEFEFPMIGSTRVTNKRAS